MHLFIRLSVAICISVATTFNPATAENDVTIPQGWKAAQKGSWYTLSQGSRLIPLSWLQALEQPGSAKRFLDPDYIRGFRYLPVAGEGSLPVGFVIDEQDDRDFSSTQLRWKQAQSSEEKWAGMNCAACHTAEITYNGKRMRIEGAPTLADFQSFMAALNEALAETRSDPAKAARFAANVLKTENNSDNRTMLNQALAKLIEWESGIAEANRTPLQYGFGRLDAFGHIFNKVAIAARRQGVAPIVNPSNAPVSYPFLWNVPQHDKVQWNGIAQNKLVRGYDVGALGRNIGEVTGVFGDVTWFESERGGPSITSSAAVDNLNALENLLRSLRPPMWPTGALGKIDEKKRDRGREVFIDKNRKNADGSSITACSECHKSLPRNNLTLPIKAKMIPLRTIGTDIWMACNAVTRQAKTGVLLNASDPKGGRYLEAAPIASLLVTTVADTIITDIRHVLRGIFASYRPPAIDGLGSTEEAPSTLPADERPVRAASEQDRHNRCLNGTDEFLAYKGRPLTGIWATAPYLHNGSVPTLYDLLLPPDQRPKAFPVGTREFDPVRVGFVTRGADGTIAPASGDNSFTFRTRDDAGRVIDGNSNAGHDFGNAALTESDRWALVEYMKGL